MPRCSSRRARPAARRASTCSRRARPARRVRRARGAARPARRASLTWKIEPRCQRRRAERMSARVRAARFANADAEGRAERDLAHGAGERLRPRRPLSGPARARRPARSTASLRTRRATCRSACRKACAATSPVRCAKERSRARPSASAATSGTSRSTTSRSARDGELPHRRQVRGPDLRLYPGRSRRRADAAGAARESWPPLTGGSGEIVVDRSTLDIRGARAQIGDVDWSGSRARSPSSAAAPRLEIEGIGARPARRHAALRRRHADRPLDRQGALAPRQRPARPISSSRSRAAVAACETRRQGQARARRQRRPHDARHAARSPRPRGGSTSRSAASSSAARAPDVLGGELRIRGRLERGPERRRHAALQRPRHGHRGGVAPGRRARHGRAPRAAARARRAIGRRSPSSAAGRRSASRATSSAWRSTCRRRSARRQRRRWRCACAPAPEDGTAAPGEARDAREALQVDARRRVAGALRSRGERRCGARRPRRHPRRRSAADALDVDLDEVDALPLELGLQPAAVAAPCRRVDRHHGSCRPRVPGRVPGPARWPVGLAGRRSRRRLVGWPAMSLSPPSVPRSVPPSASSPTRPSAGPTRCWPARPRAARRRDGAARPGRACSPAPARARPARSPTGSPTACTPGSTPAARAGRHVHGPGRRGDARPAAARSASAGVQARTFHAAALRQLRVLLAARGRRRAARGSADARPGCSPRPRPRCRLRAGPAARCATSPPRSSGPRSTRTSPEDYAAARARGRPRRRPATSTPPTWPASYAGYEEVKRGRGLIDFEDVLLLTRRRRSRTGPTSPSEVRGAVPPLRRRRVPGRQPAAAAAARAVARRPRRRSASSATPARPSTRSPGPPRPTCSASAALVPGAEVVRLVRDYRSTPQVVALANGVLRRAPAAPRRPRRLELVAQRPPGPRADVHRLRRRAGRGRRGRGRGSRALLGGRVAGRARSRCSSASTPSRRPTRRRWPTLGIPYVAARRRAVLRAARGARRRCPAARVPPARREADGPRALAGRGAATCCARRGLGRRRRPPGRAVPRASAGSASPRWSRLAERPRRPCAADATLADLVAELDERAAAQHAPTVEGVTLASLHAAKGLEWDAVFLVGLVDGHAADRPRARRPSAVEEERRLLYVGRHPRPRAPRACPGRGPATPGGRATPPALPVPRRPAARRRPGAPAGAGTPAGRGAKGRARGRSTRLPDVRPAPHHGRRSASAAAATTARPTTTRRSTTGCATWRLARSRRRLGARPTSSSPTRPWRRSPSTPSDDARRARHRSAGSGAIKLERYSDRGARPASAGRTSTAPSPADRRRGRVRGSSDTAR